MTVFLQFLADYAPFIYGAIALVAVYLIRRAILARMRLRITMRALPAPTRMDTGMIQ